MWQRFTEHARKIVFYAQEEAVRLENGAVGSKHLLLGLLRDQDTVAGQALVAQNINWEDLRSKVEASEEETQPISPKEMRLSVSGKRVIDLAYDEARFLNDAYIGTEHLLLGLIREIGGAAGKVLAEAKVELANTRDVVRKLQAGSSDKISENPKPAGFLSELLDRMRKPKPPPPSSDPHPRSPHHGRVRTNIRAAVPETLFLLLTADPEAWPSHLLNDLMPSDCTTFKELVQETAFSFGGPFREPASAFLARILEEASAISKTRSQSALTTDDLLLALLDQRLEFVDYLYRNGVTYDTALKHREN